MNKYQQDRQLQMPQGDTLPYLISHRPEHREDADLRNDGSLYLRLRVEAGVIHDSEVICFKDDVPERIQLTCRYSDTHEEVWESAPILWEPCLEYYFRLQTVTGQALFGRTGLQASLPKEARFRLAERNASDAPAWARSAVFYQIFPDRFCRTSAQEDDLEPWDSPPTSTGFKGGSLRGITSKLDYLKQLGIDALWLNPLFCSPSNHRYDTTDFYTIDPRLGTIRDLHELTHEAHVRGMRVILDGVFNHVSEEHPFFQDVVRNGQASPYWSWFKIRRWPIEERNDTYYSAWWGHGHLPELDLMNPDVQTYFLEVGTHWIHEADIDGWRLDVAGEVPLAFWQEFRIAVRDAKPDAYLLAEVWGDARPFIQGDSFDATMNYPFRRAVLEFLRGRIDAYACATHLNRLYYRLPKEVADVQYNLLGSHDVSRIRHDLGGDTKLVELAFAIQFAYPGIAALYYGDELGLGGGGDPGCRKAYRWEQPVEADLRDVVQRLASMRQHEPILKIGNVHCRAIDAHTLQICRSLSGKSTTLTVDRIQRSTMWSGGVSVESQVL